MKYNLCFLPKVENDALSAYKWYERKSKGLGEELLRMFYAACAELQQNPLLYRKLQGEFRRRLLRRFPYAIYFRIVKSEVVIFGLFHCARNPQTIQGKLKKRDKS